MKGNGKWSFRVSSYKHTTTGIQKELKRSPSLVMLITSTLRLIIHSLAPSPKTAPIDSCHGRVIRNQQYLYP